MFSMTWSKIRGCFAANKLWIYAASNFFTFCKKLLVLRQLLMKSLIALDFVFTAFEGPLSKCAQEKNNYFLFDVSYKLLLVLFCLITQFESVFHTNNPKKIAKSIASFVCF